MPTEITPPTRAKGMVHKMVAEVAKACAEGHYEVLVKQNAFYARWPHLKPFVGHNWRHYIPAARDILVTKLGDPNLDEEHKANIYEALLKDGAVNPKEMATPAKPIFTFKA